MRSLIVAMIVILFTAAPDSWGAESKKLLPPLMPPDFPQSPFGFSRGDQKRGEAIYQRNGCSSCHAIEGKGGKVGPDLTRVGETRPFADWFRQHLVSTHKPPVALAEQDMDDLIAYLQSLKFFR